MINFHLFASNCFSQRGALSKGIPKRSLGTRKTHRTLKMVGFDPLYPPYNSIVILEDVSGSQTEFGNPFKDAPRPATRSVAEGMISASLRYFVSQLEVQRH